MSSCRPCLPGPVPPSHLVNSLLHSRGLLVSIACEILSYLYISPTLFFHSYSFQKGPSCNKALAILAPATCGACPRRLLSLHDLITFYGPRLLTALKISAVGFLYRLHPFRVTNLYPHRLCSVMGDGSDSFPPKFSLLFFYHV